MNLQLSNQIALGKYIPGHSIVHELDPRIKILLGLVLVCAVFKATTIFSLCLLSLLLVVWIWQSEIPASSLVGSIQPFRWVLLITFGFHAVFGKGAWLYTWLPMTQEGLTLGFLTVFRITVLLLATGLFSLTTSSQKLVDAMNFFTKPLEWLGLPQGMVGFVMATGLRFIPILMLELERVLKAQVARGIPLEYGSLWQRVQGYVAVVVPLFVRLFLFSDHIALAMEHRCFELGKSRTSLYPIAFKVSDFVYCGLASMVLWSTVVVG